MSLNARENAQEREAKKAAAKPPVPPLNPPFPFVPLPINLETFDLTNPPPILAPKPKL